MNLYERYRPIDLKEFEGNEQLKKDLRPFVNGKREWPHSLLFTGPSGCGKTTLAYLVADFIGASERDIVKLNTADFRGIDSAREILRQMHHAPIGGASRIWILDECHKLTNDAQNALLGALEKPPAHVYFILCTTDPQNLLTTIRNRCVLFAVEKLEIHDLLSLLERVCEGEGIEIPRDVLKNIARKADGSARAAVSLLERVIGRSPKEYEQEIASYVEFESQIKELCSALLGRQSWKQVSKILNGLKEPPESIRYAVLGYMNAVLRSGKDSIQAALIIECFAEPFYNSGAAGLTLACYSILSAK